MRRVWGPMLAAFSVSIAMPTFAQESSTDSATARVLFDDARRLMDEERYEEACPKLEQAGRLDPNGSGIKFNLATCYEHTGRLASAWGLFTQVASLERLAGRAEREALAQSRAEAIAPHVPHLTIRVGSRRTGLEVRRDGTLVDSLFFDTMVPIDPGQHTVSATAPSFEPWSQTVTVMESESYVVEVPALAPVTASPSPSPPRNGLAKQQVVAIILGGAGAAALATGGFFGWRALQLRDEASPFCANDGCDPHGYTLRSDSLKAGNISTVLFVSSGALLVASAILWFTAPRPAVPSKSAALR